MITISDRRLWATWLASFVAYPIAGLTARAVAGNIDDLTSALSGGLAAGAVLGVIQCLALRSLPRQRWIAATAIGMGTGLALGAAQAGYRTGTSDLVLTGLLTGLGVGVAQGLALPGRRRDQTAWAAAHPVIWGLGWLITSNVFNDAERQHASFGASGALVATAISGVLVVASARAKRSAS